MDASLLCVDQGATVTFVPPAVVLPLVVPPVTLASAAVHPVDALSVTASHVAETSVIVPTVIASPTAAPPIVMRPNTPLVTAARRVNANLDLLTSMAHSASSIP